MQNLKKRLRSQDWFDNYDHIDNCSLYLERYMNYGLTSDELRTARPIIGIAQSGSDLNPCNRYNLVLEQRIRDGIRDAGGIPMAFPTYPLFESAKRPTCAIDRNLAYLALTEILFSYPLDGVVLTTGCDKSTPAAIMAAITADLPSIVINGGPMLDGHAEDPKTGEDRLVGSGTIIWQARRMLSEGIIDKDKFLELAMSSAPSVGHCNTMGTASTMNCIAEALGLTLTGSAIIPAPYKERAQMAYMTGKRIVEMVKEGLTISKVLTKESFLNAIRTNTAIGGSTNAQPHITAMAKHAGIEISHEEWEDNSHHLPLLANVQPSGKYLCEAFYRAGGVPAVMAELLKHNEIYGQALTVSGKTMAENLEGVTSKNHKVIAKFEKPLKKDAGFIVLSGNLFDFAIMKTSVISDDFRTRFLERPGKEGIIEARAIVFEGAEDYHSRIEDPSLNIDENCILVMRGAGPVGWPGSAEVVNMQPPAYLIKKGIESLPTLGDGRQSGTSDSPSILHVSPESAIGGNLAYLKTNDMIRIDLNKRTCDVLIDKDEWDKRKLNNSYIQNIRPSQSPWQELFRNTVSQLSEGAVMKDAIKFRQISKVIPRHNH